MRFCWECSWENGASNWKDSETCRARSRTNYPTAALAHKAGRRHKHSRYVTVYEVRRKKKR